MFFCPSAEEQDSPVRRKLIGCAKIKLGSQKNGDVLQTSESPEGVPLCGS